MIYLLQVLNLLSKKEKAMFLELFSDLTYELNELGWKDDETGLIQTMLFNHFNISIHDEFQLRMMADVILCKPKLVAAVNVATLRQS